MPLLEVRNLTTRFHTRTGVVHAVEDVSFSLEAGQTIGIVGESGSGKSVTCYSLLGLVPQPPGRIHSGQALFDGVDLLQCSGSDLRGIRGKRISMIFQDPMTSLNPYLRISTQLIEPLEIHEGLRGPKALNRAIEALEEVGIPDASQRIHAYPHEFSGGMRQRVMIAMALITRPEVLIADEPTTALDVTIQAQILELMRELQEEYHMSIMLITHDLGVVAEVADEVAVMYLGRVVEQGSVERIFEHPQHPYTKALMRSIPGVGGDRKSELQTIEGSIPDPFTRLPGCPFHPRCQDAIEGVCSVGERPELITVEEGHDVACVLYREEVARG
ncbi:MAG TPA: dipeptide/oligopeptide/nickel ABC transporter ATP-binding protein [Candidatus Latescibacteria bacterium]|nr:dipeptide/oligopeptide/nickel ABC transporter ATP-binding protein [Candidatus Latescibacterota bacterium]